MGFLRKRSSKPSPPPPTAGSPSSLSSSDSVSYNTPARTSAREMAQTRITHHPSTSTSNLSTTSTLLNIESPPRDTMPSRTTSYGAFLYHARIDAARGETLREQQEMAWRAAEDRRNQSGSRPWPHDPWRGGFGPPSSSMTVEEGTAEGRRAVKEWLRENGLLRSRSKVR